MITRDFRPPCPDYGPQMITPPNLTVSILGKAATFMANCRSCELNFIGDISVEQAEMLGSQGATLNVVSPPIVDRPQMPRISRVGARRFVRWLNMTSDIELQRGFANGGTS